MFTNLFTYTHDFYKKTNFEGVQSALKNSTDYILLNTLTESEQYCLITGTVNASMEEKVVNEMMENIEIPDKNNQGKCICV